MNTYLKALLISVVIFTIHLFAFFLEDYLQYKSFGFYGLLGGIIYSFVFAFWAYYLLVLVYIFASKNLKHTHYKYLVALAIVSIGYTLIRTGDLIDGDFKKKFSAVILGCFFLSMFIIVWLDERIKKSNG